MPLYKQQSATCPQTPQADRDNFADLKGFCRRAPASAGLIASALCLCVVIDYANIPTLRIVLINDLRYEHIVLTV